MYRCALNAKKILNSDDGRSFCRQELPQRRLADNKSKCQYANNGISSTDAGASNQTIDTASHQKPRRNQGNQVRSFVEQRWTEKRSWLKSIRPCLQASVIVIALTKLSILFNSQYNCWVVSRPQLDDSDTQWILKPQRQRLERSIPTTRKQLSFGIPLSGRLWLKWQAC